MRKVSIILSLAFLLVTAVSTFAQLCDDMLANGNFELDNGTAYWQEQSAHGLTIIDYGSGGNRLATFGGVDNEHASIEQMTWIPNGGTATLNYQYQIKSVGQCGYNDIAEIVVHGPGGVIVQPFDLCANNNTSGWVSGSINLNAFTGQPVFVMVIVQTDGADPSEFKIDNMSLMWCL